MSTIRTSFNELTNQVYIDVYSDDNGVHSFLDYCIVPDPVYGIDPWYVNWQIDRMRAILNDNHCLQRRNRSH